ncbi:DUF3592 domain-containing protein [Actinomadura sp. B10D3]|uniref:DUF3592 domain-containing protein n=1 Tax=Actinomadura sp. B10D3 TaxID=3153557 RepID=UPI00325F7D12
MSNFAFGLLLLVFGAGFGIGGVHRYRAGRSFLAAAQRVPGVVVGTHRVSRTDSYEYFPILRFRTLDGADIETVGQTNAGSYELLRLKGHQVDVLYDPRDPRSARMDTSSGRGQAGSVTLAALGCLLTGVALVVMFMAVT